MRRLTAALFAFVLLLRILVPTGFMPVQGADGIVVRICDGFGTTKSVVLDVSHDDDGQSPADHDKQTDPCGFASLSAPVLGGAPAVFLAAPALLLREFALPPPHEVSLRKIDFLTPPLRGPPSPA